MSLRMILRRSAGAAIVGLSCGVLLSVPLAPRRAAAEGAAPGKKAAPVVVPVAPPVVVPVVPPVVPPVVVPDVPSALPPGVTPGKVAAAVPPADPAVAAAQKAAALRKKVLKDDDFVENDEVNRDPFHSYLRLFIDKGSVKTRKVPAVFEKLELEELALIAIVTGDSAPRAMFRDPGGLGETVKKGDYISKSGARVTRILSDRVVVEQMETNARGEPHPVEKAILVNPDEGAR